MATRIDAVEALAPSGGDDSAAILAQATRNNGYVRLSPGEYRITAGIRTAVPIKLFGPPEDGMDLVTIKCNAALHGAITIDSGGAGAQVAGLRFSDLTMDGQVETLGFHEHRHLLSLNGVRDCRLTRVRLKGFRGDGVYFGSGPDGGQERHNNKIRVDQCEFDGVNNDNRNAISVVDGVDVVIDHSRFERVSRSNMPGAIDIEPNAFLWHRVNDIHVRSCDFKNVGGNVGVVAFTLNQITLTEPPGFFSVSDCSFDTPLANAIAVVHSNTSRDIRLSVVGNKARSCYRFINLGTAVRGVLVDGNESYAYAGSMLCGFATTDKVIDTTVTGNRFFAPPDVTNSGGLFFSSADNLLIANNLFRGQLLHAIKGGAAGASIVDTRIIGNQAKGIRNGSQYLFEHVEGWDAATCLYAQNGSAGTNLT